MRKFFAAFTSALVLGAVAGSVPAGAAAAAPRGACTPGLLFCEDFDLLPTGSASTLNWGVDTNNGTLTVEGAEPDNQVLHVHTLDNGHAFLRVDDFAAPGNRFFGRMRLRVDAFPTGPDWAHFTLVEATGAGSSEVVRPIGGQYAPTVPGIFWGVGADGGPTGDWTNWRESAPVTEDTWQCFEWTLDPADNRVAVWIDGVENPELTASTTEHGGADVPFVLPAVNTVKIGWQLYQGGTTPGEFDLWIDDIALSAERLGC
ncbi:MAG TPA: hypothetical protein VGB74_17805 [Actinoplanes sp.]|jgi:hypothetical protein